MPTDDLIYPATPSRRAFCPDGLWRPLVAFSAAAGLALALFLLFRSSSDISSLPLPRWEIFRWIDRHGELRNVPAFALLALPFMLLARSRRERARNALALALFVAVTEFGQLAIRDRYFDLVDIADGWLGLALTWSLCELVTWLARRLRDRQANPAGASDADPRPVNDDCSQAGENSLGPDA